VTQGHQSRTQCENKRLQILGVEYEVLTDVSFTGSRWRPSPFLGVSSSVLDESNFTCTLLECGDDLSRIRRFRHEESLSQIDFKREF
jgi:hypothetical protein